MWASEHESAFACIDTTTASRLLVSVICSDLCFPPATHTSFSQITTRIKGMLQQATEVELALLGLQESVELLAGVAELDTAQIPPECLEIAQLCGRLVA